MMTPIKFGSAFPNKIAASEMASLVKASEPHTVTSNQKDQATHQYNAQDYFNGAAVIDENGDETPITEKMIQDALEKLEGVNPYQPSQQ